MNQRELLAATDRLLTKLEKILGKCGQYDCPEDPAGPKAEVSEFLRTYGGPKNSFHAQAASVTSHLDRPQFEMLQSILRSFRDYVEAGLNTEVGPERRAQLDVVSDLLEQAHRVLESREVHPAAPAMLIGATLEEFLRTWAESLNLTIGTRKPGIQAYSDVLRDGEHISKQDAKDILVWAGLRNDAAHGNWEQVQDKARIQLMLEGVNLFMRKYGA
jgi:hypothetical protein